MIGDGFIGGGMLPKLNNCIDAIENGVDVYKRQRVHRAEKPVCLVDFSPYAIDTRSFPYNVWRKISRNVL